MCLLSLIYLIPIRQSYPIGDTCRLPTGHGLPHRNRPVNHMAFITQLTGLTDKWFYKLIKDGAFPAPIKLGRSSRWLKSEVEAWLQARIAQSRP